MLTIRQEGLRLLVLVAAVATIMLGLVGLLGAVRLNPGNAGFLSPPFALALIACGVLLLVGRYQASLTGLLGVVALLVLLAVLAGASWSGQVLGARLPTVGLAALTAIAGSVAAMALWRAPSAARIPAYGSTAIAVVGVVLAVSASYTMIERDRIRAHQYASKTAAQAADSVTETMRHFVTSIRRMGERWNSFNHLPAATYLEGELEGYLRDFSSLGKISVLDRSGEAFLTRQRPAHESGWVSAPPDLNEMRLWHENVATLGQAKLAPFYRQRPDGVWGLIAVPVSNAGMGDKLLVAQINVTQVLRRALAGVEDIADFRIAAGGNVLYASDDPYTSRITPITQLALQLPYDSEWTMASYLTVPAIGRGFLRIDAFPEVYLAALLLFTLAVAFSLRFAGIAQHRSNELIITATTDRVTGLPNRLRLEQLLKAAVRYARIHRTRFAVLSVSLNGVEFVNESLGHPVGDTVLQEAAQRLRQSLPERASVARFDDDSFIVLLASTDTSRVEAYIERLLTSLTRPYAVQGQDLRLTANAGYVISKGDVADPLQLMAEAELAMQDARQGGQRAWQAYSADMNAFVQERFTLLSALQHAIESDALALHYQPIVDGATGQVVAVEALLRWHDPELGPISPVRFLPLAEETGLIIPLTDWVLKVAIRASSRLRQEGLPAIPVAVNISPHYFSLDDVVARIQGALTAAALPPELLALEITEGVLLTHEEDAIKKLCELREFGVSTAIDDFGTGYSSLSYLKHLPVDKVKLDGSFVKDVVTDASSAAITRGTISMAHHLNLKIVAEMVETEAQFAFLRQHLCDQYQGYLFSRPLALDALVATLGATQGRLPLPSVAEPAQAAAAPLLVGA